MTDEIMKRLFQCETKETILEVSQGGQLTAIKQYCKAKDLKKLK